MSCVHTKLTLIESRAAIVKQGMIPPVRYYSYVGQGIQFSHWKMYFGQKTQLNKNIKGWGSVVCYQLLICTHNVSRDFPLTLTLLTIPAYCD